MPWVKVDEAFYDHPKFWDLPPGAGWLWIRALAWSNRNLTDGVVPASTLAKLRAKRRDADALVTAGLWEPRGDGWAFHDYHEFQPSAAHVRANREAKARAGRAGGLASGQTRGSKSKQPASQLLEANVKPDPVPHLLTSISEQTLAVTEPVEKLSLEEVQARVALGRNLAAVPDLEAV